MSEKKEASERLSSVAPFGLRMLPELRERIAEEAKRNGRSMNSEIVARLEQTFASPGEQYDAATSQKLKTQYQELLAKMDGLLKALRIDP